MLVPAVPPPPKTYAVLDASSAPTLPRRGKILVIFPAVSTPPAHPADFPFNELPPPSVSQAARRAALPFKRASGESAVDRETFDRLLLEQLPAAQRFAIRLTGDVNEAEDVLHDALVRVARKWSSFRADSTLRTWFFQVIINAFRDRLRARGPGRDEGVGSQRVSETIACGRCCDPLREAEGNELGEIVSREVGRLPPRQREVLVLSAYEHLSHREIAGVLETSEQNVRTTLHLARERLRAKLAGYLEAKP